MSTRREQLLSAPTNRREGNRTDEEGAIPESRSVSLELIQLHTQMDQNQKQLKFEDYLSLFHNYRADKLTISQLNQVLYIHGFVKLTNQSKGMVMHAVSSLDLVMPARSTIRTCIYCPISPLSLEETQMNLHEIDWEECPIGSVVSYKPTDHSAASDSSRSLSGVISELTEVRTKKKKKRKRLKELMHESSAGLVAEQLPVKKILHVPVATLNEFDVYSWRGNGIKKKGNIVHRWYYRCWTKSCPVRKSIHTDPQDSSMCFITYTAEHNHNIP